MVERLYSPQDTAVVLVDFLNDFLAEEGKLASEIGPMLDELDSKATYTRLIDGARHADIRLFYAPHGVDAHSFDDVPRLHPRIQHGVHNKVTWKGSWGDDFYPAFRPRRTDVVVRHHRQYDGFYATDLAEQLRAHGILKVVLAGHTSHTCVEGTGRHALEECFHVTFLEDAVAEFSEPPHIFSTTRSYPTFGHEATTVDEFLTAIGSAPDGE